MKYSFPKYCQRNLYNDIQTILIESTKMIITGSLIHGIELKNFRMMISKQYDCDNVFLTGSGRLAIAMALKVVKKNNLINGEQYVLLPFYICPWVVKTVLDAGFTPLFVSIRKDMTMDYENLDSLKIQKSVVAIIPHVYGFPAQIYKLIKKIKKINPEILIVDDAASGYNVLVGGQKLGSFGDFGILSFGQGKLLNATSGGALLLYNNKFLEQLKTEYCGLPEISLRNKVHDLFEVIWHAGLHRYADTLSYWIAKFIPYEFKPKGYFCRMANIDASLATICMKNISYIHEQRARIISNYYQRMNSHKNIFFPQALPDGCPPVSRLYFGLRGTSFILDDDGDIKEHNPMFIFARERGVKLFYPYLPPKGFMREFKVYWRKFPWLYSLLGLPIDFKRSLEWHNKVVETIMLYVRNS